jgi:transposase-like protein
LKRKVLDLIEAGRSVTDVARDLGQAIYTWRRQDRIHRGLVPGLNSAEKEELPRRETAHHPAHGHWPGNPRSS